MRDSCIYGGIILGALTVTTAVCVILMDKNRVEGSVYTCPYCGAQFTMNYSEYFKHAHIGTKVKTTCPRCVRHCFCKGEHTSLNKIAKQKYSFENVIPTI